MDGQHARQHGHHDGAARRGGGRGGGMTRSTGSTQIYRRVVHKEDAPAQEEGDGAPVRPAFKSSLQQSLQNTPPAEGNGRESRRSPRTAEPAGSRQVTASKTVDGNCSRQRPAKEEEEQPKRFVSSLAHSISSQDARYADAGGNGGRGGGRGGSTRSASRDSRSGRPSVRDNLRRGDHEASHRRVEISHGGAEHRPFTSSLASRKNSIESDTSERSVRSTHRRELEASHRRVEMQRDTRGDHRPFKSSLNGGTRPSRAGSIESDTSERSVRSTSSSRSRWEANSRGDYGLRRSIDDGRRADRGLHHKMSEERPVPLVRRFERSTSDHSAASNGSQRAPSSQASSLRGSSLANSVSSQDVRSAPASVTVAKPLAKSTQDVRVAGASASSTTWKSSLKSSLDTTADMPASKSSPSDKSPGFKSSLAASVNSESSSTAEPSADEQERKRLAAERLRERMEAKNQTRGTSLSQLLEKSPADAPRNDKSVRSESSLRDTRQPSILSRVGDKVPHQSDRESRSREFFMKLQNEDHKREMARRAAAPLQSSLLSSLARREAPSTSVKKLLYTLDQLRKVKSSPEVRPPTDLRDMTIAEVIEFRPRTQVGNSSSHGSGRRVEVSSRRGGSKRGGSSKSSSRAAPPPKKERQRGGGGGGGRRGGPPPPPLYDGPIEPLQLSENRWVPKKADKSTLESTISHVKSVLNKLTREKFAKLTDELCKTDIQSLEMLNSIITVIMDKAIEEPSFADVYADLCKEFHVRTLAKPWSFLRAAKNRTKPNVYSWTTIRLDDNAGFVGPFASENECIHAATTETVCESTSTTDQDVSKATLFVTDQELIAIIEAGKNAYFYKKKSIESLTENEPILGEYDSADAAIQAGMKQTSFKKLLVTRCQFEFEKFNKSSQTPAGDEENLDARQKELHAMRLKRKMLGNIRFIGELFKTDLLNQSVVQACLFHLLGLELVQGTSDGQLAGQEVRFPDEEDIEALCKLLATVGKKYDQPKTQTIMRIVILRLVELSEEKKLPSRSRFLLKDVLEMRDHRWEPRRKELQQKTLEEVRREAKQLQSQGKNAQHDNLNKRRLKSQVSSIQLAKESSNLLVRKDTLSENAQSSEQESSTQRSHSEASLTDPAKIETRIKSIIQEYSSIHDIDEAAACVRELPSQSLPDFAEQIVNRALEGKDQERNDVVDLLVKLYERGAVDATSIQLALVNVMEFLDDIKIDIPLAHQYSALLFGRLIAAGCFGLSWMVKEALHHLVDTGMASLVFAEALHVIEADSDERTVVRMIGDEELAAANVLPKSMRRDEAAVSKFIEEHELEVYFGVERPHDAEDDESDSDVEDCDFELDAETEHKMRSTLEEYLSVKDLGEVVLCVKELGGEDTSFFLWRHFIRVCVLYSLEAKQAVRLEVADLICRLVIECTDDVDVTDVEEAFEAVLADYEDVRVDVPRLADNFAELWTPLFEKPDCMTLDWLHEAVAHLIPSGYAAEVLSSFLTRFDTLFGREKLAQWWQQQEQQRHSVLPDSASWLVAFSSVDDKAAGVHERLVAWEQSLQGSP